MAVGPHKLQSVPFLCGVPEGSILGPMIFTLDIISLIDVISNFEGISKYMYVDDL